MKKIVIVCPAGILSGKEVVCLNLARGLRQQGVEVHFLVSRWSNGDFVKRLQTEGFQHHSLWMGYIAASFRFKPLMMTADQLWRWPSLVRNYRRLLSDIKPQLVIHTNWHHAFLLAPFLNKRRDAYWAHEVSPNRRREGYLFRMIARRVARMVCVSHAVADAFERLGVAKSALLVVHNAPTVSGAIAPLGLPAPLRLGIVGQIAPWKGHDDLLDAMAQLGRQNIRVIVKIFGKGDPAYLSELKAKASKLGIEDRIEWRGFVADQAAIFGDMDVCVMPSRFEEPLGMSVLEAGLCGRPAICSLTGGLPEIVRDGETGILVEPARPDSLAAAISAFVRQPELVATMGQKAREWIEKEFSQSEFVGKFIALTDGLKS